MNLTGSVALVTGANRGLGARLVAGLLRAGAAKVYATSRTGEAAGRGDPRVQPLRLDVTDPASIAAAAEAAPGTASRVRPHGSAASRVAATVPRTPATASTAVSASMVSL